MAGSKEVRVLGAGEECPALPLVEAEGVARALIWPGIGAYLRSMHRISLAPGARRVPQRHPMEAVYYVLSGEGIVRDPEHPPEQLLVEGSMVHVEPGTAYGLEAGAEGIETLGGPCPADAALYAGLSA